MTEEDNKNKIKGYITIEDVMLFSEQINKLLIDMIGKIKVGTLERDIDK